MKTMLENKFFEMGNITVSWVFAFFSLPITAIPIILSSIASLMAIVNYYYQIKKHKK